MQGRLILAVAVSPLLLLLPWQQHKDGRGTYMGSSFPSSSANPIFLCLMFHSTLSEQIFCPWLANRITSLGMVHRR